MNYCVHPVVVLFKSRFTREIDQLSDQLLLLSLLLLPSSGVCSSLFISLGRYRGLPPLVRTPLLRSRLALYETQQKPRRVCGSGPFRKLHRTTQIADAENSGLITLREGSLFRRLKSPACDDLGVKQDSSLPSTIESH